MNELIRELRTQAAAWVAENHQPQDPNAYSQKEIDQRYLMYEEKFAELIVLKCAELVAGVPTDTLGYHTADQKIKEHFGVEE